MSIFVFNCFALDFVYLVPLRAALAGVSLACRRGGLFYSFGLEFFLHTTLHIHLLICLDDLGMLFFFLNPFCTLCSPSSRNILAVNFHP